MAEITRTDRHTHTHTQTKYCNPLGHAPKVNDGTILYFIAAPLIRNNAYHTDMDVASDEQDISCIGDDSVHAEQRWEEYLQGLELNSWGDYVVFQGLAHLLENLDIHIISTINPDMDLSGTSHQPAISVRLCCACHGATKVLIC